MNLLVWGLIFRCILKREAYLDVALGDDNTDRCGDVRNVHMVVKLKQDPTENRMYKLILQKLAVTTLLQLKEVLSRTLGSELGGTVNAGCHWSDLGQ